MTHDAYVPYEPLQTIKAFAEEVWIVDGPEIEMRYLGVNIPFPTRMTIVRLTGPPGLVDRARRPISIDETVGKEPPARWAGLLSQCLIRGGVMTEVDFFHRPSRTLILTDIIENFELSRVRGALLRWVMKTFGAADPDGKAPYDMQLSFLGHRRNVRAAAELMITWAPERIVIAHGHCYETQAVAELRRAFRWVL